MDLAQSSLTWVEKDETSLAKKAEWKNSTSRLLTSLAKKAIL